MAARTKTAPVSKSAQARDLFDQGKSVAEVAKTLHIGYAFAYGIAKRHGVEQTAASRRKTRAVRVTDTGDVEVLTTTGLVIVHPDGKVTRRKAR